MSTSTTAGENRDHSLLAICNRLAHQYENTIAGRRLYGDRHCICTAIIDKNPRLLGAVQQPE